MGIILLTTITIIVAVLINPISKKVSRKVDDKRYLRVHVHHSVTGLFILAVGLAFANTIIVSLGLGMYLAHGLEEMYYNKKPFPVAFFILITR
jgi:uncharacterized membrane protein